jgi:heptosyltransferase II
LGDVVLTAPVYQKLKEHWPECTTVALVKPQFAPALQGNPAIDRVVAFEGIWKTLAFIKDEGVTHLLDLHGNLRSRLIRALSRVAHVAAYRKDALARRLFVAFGRPSPALQRHTVERYLDALRPWGIAAGAADLRLDQQREGRAPLEGDRPQNVLVIQSAFLGDTLLTLPLMREVKAALPGSRVAVLTLEKNAEIFKGSEWVDEIIFDDKRGRHSGIFGLRSLAREIGQRGFDLAIVPHRSFRSALLGWLAGIPRRVGFSSSAGKLFFTRTVAFSWPMHDLERNLSLVLPLKPDLAVRAGGDRYLKEDPEAAKRIAGRLPQGRLVGVHPGSTWPTKRWLADRFSEVCRRLKAAGLTPVLVGAKQDIELCRKIAAESGALDLCGKTTLAELVALSHKLSLFITNDSGPMHVATACGVPTLAIFGPTTRELGFFPYGAGHRVIEHELACRPCGLHGGRECPHGHFLCMKLTTVEDVWRQASEMLELKTNANPAR